MADELPNLSQILASLDSQETALLVLIDKATRQLAQVRQARATLAGADEDEPITFEGKLADAIRTVLMARNRSHTPIEVRDQVKALGYTFKEGSNEMAAVHGVLKRLKDSGVVRTKEWSKRPGVTRYFWAAPRTFTIQLGGQLGMAGTTLPAHIASTVGIATPGAVAPNLRSEREEEK